MSCIFLSVLLFIYFYLFFIQRLSLSMKLTGSARFTGHGAAGIYLSPCWNCRRMLQYLAFHTGPGVSNSCPHTCMASPMLIGPSWKSSLDYRNRVQCSSFHRVIPREPPPPPSIGMAKPSSSEVLCGTENHTAALRSVWWALYNWAISKASQKYNSFLKHSFIMFLSLVQGRLLFSQKKN